MWEKFKKWRYAGSELSTVERREVLEELANTGTVYLFPWRGNKYTVGLSGLRIIGYL